MLRLFEIELGHRVELQVVEPRLVRTLSVEPEVEVYPSRRHGPYDLVVS